MVTNHAHFLLTFIFKERVCFNLVIFHLSNVKWNISWKNLKILSGVNAEEKEFVWKVIQDMVPVGRRIHKKNVERRCLKVLPSGNECQVIPDLRHVFFLMREHERFVLCYEKYM